VNRIEVLIEFVRNPLPLMRERHSIYALGRICPSEQLMRLLGMAAVGAYYHPLLMPRRLHDHSWRCEFVSFNRL
jgi:hypothetical protein